MAERRGRYFKIWSRVVGETVVCGILSVANPSSYLHISFSTSVAGGGQARIIRAEKRKEKCLCTHVRSRRNESVWGLRVRVCLFFSVKEIPPHTFPAYVSTKHPGLRSQPPPPRILIVCQTWNYACTLGIWHCVCVHSVCALSPFARRDSVPMIEAVSAAAGADAVCTLANHLLSRGFATALSSMQRKYPRLPYFLYIISNRASKLLYVHIGYLASRFDHPTKI